MKRREFTSITAAAAAGLAMGLNTSAAKAPADGAKRKPNILFIMTDQQSATMMSCTGNKWLKTPALDSLAASGVRFERAYACNPVCVPARFSLQTGLMPSAIGMGENKDSGRSKVTDAMVTQSIGPLLSDAGYETVYGGKVHMPKQMNRVQNMAYRMLTRDFRGGLAKACAKFIKGPHKKPFFMFASFMNPHDICYMALNDYHRSIGRAEFRNTDSKICEGVLKKPRAGDVDAFVKKNCPPLPANHNVPPNEPEAITTRYTSVRQFRNFARRKWTDRNWRLHRWAYCRLTEMVDAHIGVVLDALKTAGLEDDTVVIFTSDHGDMDSAHKLEHKSILYEEAARIPFIMSHKNHIPKGKVDDTHLISNGLDLICTLCDYAGIETPKGRSGASVRPLAEGKKVSAWRDSVVVESQNGRMLRTGRYKYCIYDSGAKREQLIDLTNDPGEMKNLADDPEFKTVLDKHRKLLAAWVKQTNDKIGAKYIRAV
ncbi:MAG: sulfatase-like hydrolase/transferase [Phycisphaerae bacterium]|jgi:choline-sulfatase|nr:sulfatase-like hydrolase/transferase [Phycisphaerae bacterium]